MSQLHITPTGIKSEFNYTINTNFFSLNSWPTIKAAVMMAGLQMAAILNDIFNYPVTNKYFHDDSLNF
jgi:hypothetical protein